MKERLSISLLVLSCTVLCVMSACSQAKSNDIVAEGESPVRVSDSYSFTEGPAADARGDVYFTDQPNNKIYRWDCESGEITLFTDQSGRSNGMFFDAEGNLIACADMDNQLWRFDMKGQAETLYGIRRDDDRRPGKYLSYRRRRDRIRQEWAEDSPFPHSRGLDSKCMLWRKRRNVLFITASKSVYTLNMLVHGIK